VSVAAAVDDAVVEEELPHALRKSATAPVAARRRRAEDGRDMRVDLSVA
jgi:hypothetical protein